VRRITDKNVPSRQNNNSANDAVIHDFDVHELEKDCSHASSGSQAQDNLHNNDEENDTEAVDAEGPVEQILLREFEAVEELKELMLQFLFVIFFAPIVPFAMIPQLGACIVGIRFKLTKLFLVKRRPFPADEGLVNMVAGVYVHVVVVASSLWHAGLIFIAYNKKLHEDIQGCVSQWACYSVGSALLLVCLIHALRVLLVSERCARIFG